ncbi:MAG: hypothetical protein PHQ80_03840 [Candidatus ainarchaeum sp.]|nr:hypothetical protein [Candidatus ainarchaeum sp.]
MPVKKFIDSKVAFISRQIDVAASKIRINPGSSACRAGGKASAAITLELKKPVRARSLSARIYCVEEKKVESTREMVRDDYRMDKELGVQRSTHLRTTTSVMETVAYAETKQVSGEKEYWSGKYEVEFSIPDSAPRSQQWSGGRRVTWRMEAKLDIPMSMDVSSSVEIEVC